MIKDRKCGPVRGIDMFQFLPYGSSEYLSTFCMGGMQPVLKIIAKSNVNLQGAKEFLWLR